jgi:TonB-linked SusC/RagA family outer membrane protein
MEKNCSIRTRRLFSKGLWGLILMFLFVFSSGGSQILAQTQAKYSIKFENSTVVSSVKKMQIQLGVNFFYDSESLKQEVAVVNKTFTNNTLDEILKSVLEGTSLSYNIVNNVVIIAHKETVDEKSKTISKDNNITVSGVVLDKKGESVIAANIWLVGTKIGAYTDIDGAFTIVMPANGVLEVSAISYETKQVTPNGANHLVITMNDDAINLKELVVIGYGTIKKGDVTGSVASIKSEDITKQAVLSADQALQGRLPGVQVVSNSGSPGGSASVRIRGIGTVNDAEPLYVVDGMPVSSISYLNTNDITSMEVLKDASASAIYGSRGANGVVLISTRKGNAGKTKISFSGYAGVQNSINNQQLLNGPQWYDLQAEINKTRTNKIDLSKVNRNTSTDWMKEVTQVAPIQNYNLDVNGGEGDILYAASVGYFNQDGTIKGTKFDRLTLRLNSEAKIMKNVTLGSNLSLSIANRSQVLEGSESWGIVSTAVRLEPVVPVYNADGTYGSSPYVDSNNPVASIQYTDTQYKNLNLVGNIFLNIDILKNLKFKSTFGVDMKKEDYYDFVPQYFVSTTQKNDESIISRGYLKRDNWLWENTLNYNKTFAEKHSLNALVGYTMEETREENLFGSKKGVPADLASLKYLNAAQNATSASVSGAAWESAMISYLGRVNYGFDDRILATLSLRADGSSKFAKQNRYAIFPSFSLAWKINNEKFFRQLNYDWVNALKLRAGWGQIGNQNIGNYLFQSTLTSGAQYRYLYGMPESIYQGVVAVGMANDKIKWETSESENFGLDIVLFKNLNIVTDYFIKTTKDMLLMEPIPYHMGFETGPVTNVGSVRNKGIEFQISWKGSFSNDLYYSIGANFSSIDNKVLSLGTGKAIPGGSVFQKGYATLTQVGYPIGVYWGFKTDGLVQNEAQLTEVKTRQPSAGLGDVIYKDINGYNADGKTLSGVPDGKLNDADKTMIGSPIPDFTYGINLGFGYKGLEFSAFFDGVQGNEIFNATRSYIYGTNSIYNKHIDVLNYWTPENTNTTMPRVNGNDINDNLRISDRYVEDGSFLRLKNIQLTYTFPKSFTSKLKIEGIKVYVSAQNLLTITKYSGLYPEIGQLSTSNYLSRGVDMGTYPQNRTITGGLSINF